MLKKEITFTDFNGTERTQVFYFNISQAELTEMQMGQRGGMENYLQILVDSKDERRILDFLKSWIRAAYGVRSDDGAEFVKTLEGWNSFKGSGAYDALFMEMVEDQNLIPTFMIEVIPPNMRKAAEEAKAANVPNGFRPGADTTRPTPPVAGASTDAAESPVVPPASSTDVASAALDTPAEPVATPNDPAQFQAPADVPATPTQVPSPELAQPVDVPPEATPQQ